MKILDAWLALSLPLRYAILMLTGFVVGAVVNLGIYSLVFRPQPISPWARTDASLNRARRWQDRLPVIGWLLLRREELQFGRLFWIRPLLIELFCGLGLAALYWWEVVEQGLYPLNMNMLILRPEHVFHAQFFAHALLFALLIVATFTDFDDRTIPDMITVPGTIAGMLILSLVPAAILLTVNPRPPPLLVPLYAMIESKHITGLAGLFTALAILAGWSFALLNKVCTLRHGWLRGVQYFFVSIVRYRSWLIHLPILLLLCLYTLVVWSWGGVRWQCLFTSIMGIAVGGGIVWSVRVVGRHSFGMEAMGFGDVTLMAMIGSFLGWQAAVVTFFLAPLTAVVVGAIQWLMTRDNRIAFGPYLSLAAVVLIVFWHRIWTMWLGRIFDQGLLVAVILVGSLPLLGLLMWLMRKFRDFRESRA